MKLEKKGMNVTSLWKKSIGSFIGDTDISRYELIELSDKNSELNYLDLGKEVFYCEDFNEHENFFNTFDFDNDNRFLFNNSKGNRV